jgi:hypothetical protein
MNIDWSAILAFIAVASLMGNMFVRSFWRDFVTSD